MLVAVVAVVVLVVLLVPVLPSAVLWFVRRTLFVLVVFVVVAVL